MALDLGAAVEAAEQEVPCLKGSRRVIGVSVIDVPSRAERAVEVIAPHVLRAAADELGKQAPIGAPSWDRGYAAALGILRELADEIGGDRG